MRTISQLPRTRASLGVLAVFVALMVIPAATQRGAGNEPVRVEGGLISATLEDGVRAYKGIPYAAPPVGELRWQPPQPVAAWTGVCNGDTVGAACPHLTRAPGGFLAEVTEPKSEDCLFLNVWTAGRPGDRRPVMVWYHGGGWRSGSGTPVDKESDLRNAQRVGGHRTFNLPMRTWARLATAAGRSKT